ncbi:MAG: SdpI family protein, partial [Thermococcus sp.]|nr:SdpI family protein [Thermococcus sp.]
MSETAFEMFVSLALLLGGLLALAFRKRRNPLIGFRVGYTYHSERVWEKVNTFAGIFSIVYS